MIGPNFKVNSQELKQPLLQLNPYLVDLALLSADVVRSNTTMTALDDLKATLESGGKYSFSMLLRVDDSAGEGMQLDLHGGTVTVSELWAIAEFFDLGLGHVVPDIDALTDLASIDSFAGGKGFVRITGFLVVNAAGTLIPRVAQASHSSGSLTVKAGSPRTLQEVSS